MRTVFLGTSAYAAAILRRLADSEHRPVLAIAPPDSRAGRGRRPSAPPIAEAAADLGIEVHRSADVNEAEARALIEAARPQAGIVCAFGQLVREPLLSDLALLNVHPSLLPRWRGAAPIERAILAGDELTGVTIMRLTAGLDSGPIALAEAVEIGDRNYGELSAELERLGGDLLVRALDRLAAGSLEFTEQDEKEATYAEKIDPRERALDPARPALELARRVRALTPHVGAYLELADGTRLGVRGARPAAALPASAADDSDQPGALSAADGILRLRCGEGVLEITEVQPAGKRPMAAAAYLRGHARPELA